MVVKNGMDNYLLHQSPALFKKIDECRGQLMKPSELKEDVLPDILVTNTNILATDIVKHIKLINETECPDLLNVEVPKVFKFFS